MRLDPAAGISLCVSVCVCGVWVCVYIYSCGVLWSVVVYGRLHVMCSGVRIYMYTVCM